MKIYQKTKQNFEKYFPRFFKRANKRKKAIKYVIAGGTAAFVHIFFLYIFTDIFNIWYIISTSVAFIFAFVVSFTLQKFWTFRDGNCNGIKKQAVKYFIVTSFTLMINAVFMYLLVDYLNIMYLFAQIITSGTLAFGSFFINKIFIFKNAE